MNNSGELLLLNRVGDSVPYRNGKPMGVIDEYGDICVCCGNDVPEGRQVCLSCERREEK